MTSIEALRDKQTHVAMVGLGYVRIPLIAALSRHYMTSRLRSCAPGVTVRGGAPASTDAPHHRGRTK